MFPCDDADPAGAPAIKHEVKPVILDAVRPMCDGDPVDVAPTIPWEDAPMIPAPVIPVPVIPGNADP